MFEQVRILLVEDSEGDIVLTLEALKEANVVNTVDVVRDGEQALQFLRKEEPYAAAVTPDIIFLDINLPKIDGSEILSIIKNDETLKVIPVIILTTSDAESDIMRSYCNHANCYITKPVGLDKFIEVIQTIKSFWISIVKLPKTKD